MDIQANKELYNSLVYHNSKLTNNYGNVILETSPKDKKYPFTLLQPIRDVSVDNNCYGKVSNKGYRVDIYAQNKGKVLKKDIAEQIAQEIDNFMGYVGLARVSYNYIDLENEGTLAHIIMTYSANLDEYRRRFF